MDPLRVLLVAADPLARSGLAALLSSQPGLAVTGQAAPDAALGAAIEAAQPDAAVWDLGPGGPAPTDRLREAAGAGLPALALAGSDAAAGEALAAGARGALPRGAPPEQVAAALPAVARGLVVLDGRAAGELLRPPPASPDEPLTRREREVLDLLGEGLSNKAIAARLRISEHTAKFHVNAILGKLGAQSRAEAAVKAARLGLLAL